MLRNIKISVKVAALIIALSLVSVLAISIFTYQQNVQSAQEKIKTTVSTIADHRAAQFNNYFDNLKSRLELLQQSKTFLNDSIGADSLSEAAPETILLKAIQESHDYERALLTNAR